MSIFFLLYFDIASVLAPITGLYRGLIAHPQQSTTQSSGMPCIKQTSRAFVPPTFSHRNQHRSISPPISPVVIIHTICCVALYLRCACILLNTIHNTSSLCSNVHSCLIISFLPSLSHQRLLCFLAVNKAMPIPGCLLHRLLICPASNPSDFLNHLHQQPVDL